MHKVRKKERKIIFASVLLIDQLSKFLIIKFGLASINQGVLFGTLFHGSITSLLFVFLILGLAMFWYFKRSYNLGLLLVIAGGISNLIDRLYRGGVVDFIKLPVGPAFNLADLAIVLGCVLLLIDLLKANWV